MATDAVRTTRLEDDSPAVLDDRDGREVRDLRAARGTEEMARTSRWIRQGCGISSVPRLTARCVPEAMVARVMFGLRMVRLSSSSA